MYRIEFIHKKSVYNDIIENWTKLGKENESEHGFVFECESVNVFDGMISIWKDDSEYIYNTADFYRVKITRV